MQKTYLTLTLPLKTTRKSPTSNRNSKMKRDVRDGKYAALNEKRSNVGEDMAGSQDYGDDSPLYGAMGFVRKSHRASGLTRKTKTPVK